MKRDRRLRQLSDDHHQALVLARRATSAASVEPEALAALWEEAVLRERALSRKQKQLIAVAVGHVTLCP